MRHLFFHLLSHLVPRLFLSLASALTQRRSELSATLSTRCARRITKGRTKGKTRALTLVSLACVMLGACSGVEVIPDDTAAFTATKYTRYAWRSEPPSKSGYGTDKLPQTSPAIRASFEEKMAELGYRRVAKADAQFLVEYLATAGYNDGQLARQSSNSVLYPSSVNRQIDGASVDNAYALGGVVETGNLALIFVDVKTSDVLWKVKISTVVEDTNRVDEGAVRSAVRQGLSSLPSAQ